MANAAVQLRAHNGQWVCAEGGGGQALLANRAVPDVWETFTLLPIQGGTLQDGSLVAIQVSRGHWVCAELGGGRDVNANRAARREWETFTLRRLAGAGPLQTGDKIGFQTYNNQYFLCAEAGGGREIIGNRKRLDIWETFVATVLPPRRVRIEFDSVTCSDSEDVTFSQDQFYAVGAGADRFSGKSVACLSIPFNIKTGQTKSFPAATNERVLFEGDVDAASTILVGAKFWDEDSHKDWSKHKEMVTKLQGTISTGLGLLGPTGIAVGGVLAILTQGLGLVMSLDQDDLLGDKTLELPVSRLPIGTSIHTLDMRWNPGGIAGWWSGWSYQVRMKITVN